MLDVWSVSLLMPDAELQADVAEIISSFRCVWDCLGWLRLEEGCVRLYLCM